MRWLAAVAGLTTLVFQVGIGPASTSARFSAASSSPTSGFTGATLSPAVAPVITPVMAGRTIKLEWNPVNAPRSVAYSVERTLVGGATSTVCLAPSIPIVSNGLVACTDSGAMPDATYTYTELPYIDIPGSTPWSLPRSTSSVPFLVPRLSYLAAGSDVSSTGTSINVPYPTGTQSGDVLLLVSVSGRNKAPTTPTGWNQLVSQGIGGSSSSYLFVAWRVADAGTSVTLDPQANGSGASTRIVNYGRTNGNSATPVVATSSVVSGTATASTTFTPPTNVVTNASNAVVVSIMATNGATSPSLATSMGFTLRLSNNSTPGSGSVSIGLADTNVAMSGSSVSSPTWSQTGTSQAWLFATVAFR